MKRTVGRPAKELFGVALGCTLALGAYPAAGIASEVVVEPEGTGDTAFVVHGEEPVQLVDEGDVQMAVQGISVPYLDASGRPQTADNVRQLTSSANAWTGGWYVVDSSMEIDQRIYVAGHVHLILANGVTLTASKGITVTSFSYNLTIYAQSTGDTMGKLVATADGVEPNAYAAGIGGGGIGQSGSEITINGGNIQATSSEGGAGIGGGKNGGGGTIAINGGTVTARGGDKAAGIGGGCQGAGGEVCINGGKVTAIGTNGGKGIGAGSDGTNDGTVMLGAGIGVKAGDDEASATNVTTTFKDRHDQTWVQTIVLATGVSIDPTSATLTAGDTTTLTATVTPDHASYKTVTWTSSNEAVAKVDGNGKMTAVAAGTATITATADDGSGQSATCTITVKAKPVIASAPSVTAHVQRVGWMPAVTNGGMAGTTGRSRRLEALTLKLPAGVSGGIEYRSHVQKTGWEKTWKANGKASGTVGKSRRVEAVQIRLTGAAKDTYDVYYRVHVQKFGWMAWAKNGENAGTQGMSRRAEAIQVALVKKGDPAPAKTYKGVTQTYAKAFAKK